MRKVNWAQVGKITEPGRYMFRFGFVIVTAEDLAIWQKYPEAAFTLIPLFSSGPQEEYKLGAFDVGGVGDPHGEEARKRRLEP